MIPREIRYGGLIFKVEGDTALTKQHGNPGVAFRDYEEFRIDASLPAVCKKEALWLLLCDRLQEDMGVSWEEHNPVSRLLFCVIQDNPCVLRGFPVQKLEYIRLFGINYAVVSIPSLERHTGALDRQNKTVAFHPTVPDRVARDTFWHEVMHQVLHVLDIEEDEDEIDRIAFMIMMLCAQNDMSWAIIDV